MTQQNWGPNERAWLAERVAQAAVSQEELARLAELSPKTVARWCNPKDRTQPRAHSLVKVFRLLGLPVQSVEECYQAVAGQLPLPSALPRPLIRAQSVAWQSGSSRAVTRFAEQVARLGLALLLGAAKQSPQAVQNRAHRALRDSLLHEGGEWHGWVEALQKVVEALTDGSKAGKVQPQRAEEEPAYFLAMWWVQPLPALASVADDMTEVADARADSLSPHAPLRVLVRATTAFQAAQGARKPRQTLCEALDGLVGNGCAPVPLRFVYRYRLRDRAGLFVSEFGEHGVAPPTQEDDNEAEGAEGLFAEWEREANRRVVVALAPILDWIEGDRHDLVCVDGERAVYRNDADGRLTVRERVPALAPEVREAFAAQAAPAVEPAELGQPSLDELLGCPPIRTLDEKMLELARALVEQPLMAIERARAIVAAVLGELLRMPEAGPERLYALRTRLHEGPLYPTLLSLAADLVARAHLLTLLPVNLQARLALAGTAWVVAWAGAAPVLGRRMSVEACERAWLRLAGLEAATNTDVSTWLRDSVQASPAEGGTATERTSAPAQPSAVKTLPAVAEVRFIRLGPACRHEVIDGPVPATLGRRSRCTVPIDSPHVSREHVEIRHDTAGLSLVNRAAATPTFVDGLRLAVDESVPLAPGSLLACDTELLWLAELRPV